MIPFNYFLTVLQLHIKKRENVVPSSFVSALDKIGMDVKKTIGRFFIYFLQSMVYACNQNSQLQLNVSWAT